MSTRCMSFDPATVTGYAFGVFGKKPMSGVIQLPPRSSASTKHCHLEGRVRDLLDANRVEMIVVEDIFAARGKRFSMETLRFLAGCRTAIGMAAHKAGLDTTHCLKFVMPGKWRKTFNTNEVPPIVRAIYNSGKDDNAIRKFQKKAAFERCIEMGWEPEGEDEADALGIWHYGESLFHPDIGVERQPLFQASMPL